MAKKALDSDVRPQSMWGIQKFPTALKNRFSAYCKANDRRVVDVLEYVVAKFLRDEGISIPDLRPDNSFVYPKGKPQN